MAQQSADLSANSGNPEQKAIHTPKAPARAGEKWTAEEKVLLAQLIRSGRDVEEIANQLLRSPGAVRSRMMEKGLLARQEPDVQLEAEFHQAMLEVYEVAARHKYTATRFLQLVRNRGGVEAARLLLAREEVTTGLKELQKLDLLEHSAKATVLQERFRSLFTDAERQKARQRLESLGFVPTWVTADRAGIDHAEEGDRTAFGNNSAAVGR